jgi:hypothetical protein
LDLDIPDLALSGDDASKRNNGPINNNGDNDYVTYSNITNSITAMLTRDIATANPNSKHQVTGAQGRGPSESAC